MFWAGDRLILVEKCNSLFCCPLAVLCRMNVSNTLDFGQTSEKASSLTARSMDKVSLNLAANHLGSEVKVFRITGKWIVSHIVRLKSRN